MQTLQLTDPDVVEKVQDILSRNERFSLVVDEATAKWVKKLQPMINYLWGPDRGKINGKRPGFTERIKAFKYSLYALFTGSFGGVYFYTMEAGMKAKWEERDSTIVLVFEPDTVKSSPKEEFNAKSDINPPKKC